MENRNNQKKGWRTREEKESIVRQWQASGKSRKVFCDENGIGYNSLVSWCKQLKDARPAGFSQVKLSPTVTSELYAQAHFPGGIRIDFYQPFSSDFIRSFLL